MTSERWGQMLEHELYQTAKHNMLQHTATHCYALQHIATHRNTLQHTSAHCNAQVLERKLHQLSLWSTLKFAGFPYSITARNTTRFDTLQHIATHCNALQRTATHCNTQVLEHELYQLFPWFKFRFAGFPLFVDDLEILPPDDARAKPQKDVLDVQVKNILHIGLFCGSLFIYTGLFCGFFCKNTTLFCQTPERLYIQVSFVGFFAKIQHFFAKPQKDVLDVQVKKIYTWVSFAGLF